MAVTIPAGDVDNYALQTEITALATAITNNPLLATPLAYQKLQLQTQLVLNLIAAATGGAGNGDNAAGVKASTLNPATILSTCTVNT